MNPPGSIAVWQGVPDALDMAVWLVDAATLRIAYANAAAGVLVGREPSAMLGASVLELAATPEDQIFWSQDVQALMRGIRSRSGVFRAGSGDPVAVERSVCALPGAAAAGVLLLTMRDCSAEEETERRLQEQVEQMAATLDATADGMLSCDLQGRISGFNRAWAELWRVPEALLLHRDDTAIQAHMLGCVADGAAYRERLQALVREPMNEAHDVLRLADGRLVERRAVPLWLHGYPGGRVFLFQDVTAQVQQQADLRLAALAFDASLEPVFVADAEGVVVRLNPCCERLWGVSAAEAVGASAWRFLCPEDGQARLAEQVRAAWDAGRVWEGKLFLPPRADGGEAVAHLSWVALRDAQGRVTQSIGFAQDLTAQHAAEQRIEELALRDALTGLPNRLAFNQRVSQAIEQEEGPSAGFAVMLLDLDRFKNINDSLGHTFGDRALRVVAQRLLGCLHHSDMLCRLGGDEFVVYLHAANAAAAQTVARRVMDAVAHPCTIDDMTLSLQCTIGIALYPQQARTPDELVSQADAAMNRAKERGRGSYEFFEPGMNADLLPRMKLEHALRQALPSGHMALHYQPQVDVRTGVIMGAEALLRWTDPQLGSIPPSQFIPLAEERGYIATLGAWVMERAIADAALWARGGAELVVAVNVSALEFRQPGFVERVRELLARHGLAPRLLELELTESVLLSDAGEMENLIGALAAMGVQLAIDDFGTGYSSLAYLKRLKIHKLKIDQSFVRGLPGDEGDRAIVQAVVDMGSALRMKVLAEGVETQAQRLALEQMRCAQYQGFLCSRALPVQEFLALTARGPR